MDMASGSNGSVTDPSFVGMTGGEEQRKKSKDKTGKAVVDESNPLPREAGSWELERPAVTATRPTAKSHSPTVSYQPGSSNRASRRSSRDWINFARPVLRLLISSRVF